ncbi:hypothetical protein FB451DRAFT_1191111 [Mycena latifolia]|nr:hypothetical protein FB451DRAFT_1191111 [Mycena latifolia]
MSIEGKGGPGSPHAPYLPPHLRNAQPAPTPVFRSEAVFEKHEEAPEEAILGSNNVTTRRRSPRAPPAQRPVSPIPDESLIITPPKKTKKRKVKTTVPHRPAPQVQERAPRNKTKPAERSCTPEHAAKPRAVSAKKERYAELLVAADATASLDALALVLGETVSMMWLLGGMVTKACLDVLEAISERLVNHHEYPCTDDSLVSPVKLLAAQVEAQHRAIQSLTKTVESFKNAPVLAARSCEHGSFAKAAASPPPQPKPPKTPLPNPSDERLLICFDGEAPPLLSRPYPVILATLNEGLMSLGLPLLVYTQKQSDKKIFIVPRNKDDLGVLEERWSVWGPAVLPGGGWRAVRGDGNAGGAWSRV